jgi:hypothetical protein
MRLYSFVLNYLSSIQQGIQTAHVLQEMNYEYLECCHTSKDTHLLNKHKLLGWAKNHKTIIILNGGTRADIQKIYLKLNIICHDLGLPFAKFHEDEDSLGGIITSCCVVVPERLYGALTWKEACLVVPDLMKRETDSFYYLYLKDPGFPPNVIRAFHRDLDMEWELISIIKSCPLAR